MKTITQEEWDEKVRLHGIWVKDQSSGERLELEGYDLSELVFKKCKSLRYASLKNCNLQGVSLKNLDLKYSNLKSADLRRIELQVSDLRGSDLSRVDLRNSDLSKSDLSSSNLNFSNLTSSTLENSNLEGVNLHNTTGNGKEIKTHRIGKYTINYTSKVLQIGHLNHEMGKWFWFTNEQIDGMDHGLLEWWRKYKGALKIILKKDPAIDSNNYQNK